MAPKMFEPAQDTVMGHEFCCEVLETGPGVDNLKAGDVIVSMPVVFGADGLHAIGFSNTYPGGYAEMMVLNEMLGIKVPNGLSHELAALHRAARGRRARGRQEPHHPRRARSCSAADRSVWRASPR